MGNELPHRKSDPIAHYFPTCKCGMAVVALLQEAEFVSWRGFSFADFEPLLSDVETSCPSIDFPQLEQTIQEGLKTPGTNMFTRVAGQLMENFRECHPSHRGPPSVKDGLEHSIEEEQEAAHLYKIRSRAADAEGDFETKALYNYLEQDEGSHAQELGARVRVYGTVKDASPEDLKQLHEKITGKEVEE